MGLSFNLGVLFGLFSNQAVKQMQFGQTVSEVSVLANKRLETEQKVQDLKQKAQNGQGGQMVMTEAEGLPSTTNFNWAGANKYYRWNQGANRLEELAGNPNLVQGPDGAMYERGNEAAGPVMGLFAPDRPLQHDGTMLQGALTGTDPGARVFSQSTGTQQNNTPLGQNFVTTYNQGIQQRADQVRDNERLRLERSIFPTNGYTGTQGTNVNELAGILIDHWAANNPGAITLPTGLGAVGNPARQTEMLNILRIINPPGTAVNLDPLGNVTIGNEIPPVQIQMNTLVNQLQDAGPNGVFTATMPVGPAKTNQEEIAKAIFGAQSAERTASGFKLTMGDVTFTVTLGDVRAMTAQLFQRPGGSTTTFSNNGALNNSVQTFTAGGTTTAPILFAPGESTADRGTWEERRRLTTEAVFLTAFPNQGATTNPANLPATMTANQTALIRALYNCPTPPGTITRTGDQEFKFSRTGLPADEVTVSLTDMRTHLTELQTLTGRDDATVVPAAQRGSGDAADTWGARRTAVFNAVTAQMGIPGPVAATATTAADPIAHFVDNSVPATPRAVPDKPAQIYLNLLKGLFNLTDVEVGLVKRIPSSGPTVPDKFEITKKGAIIMVSLEQVRAMAGELMNRTNSTFNQTHSLSGGLSPVLINRTAAPLTGADLEARRLAVVKATIPVTNPTVQPAQINTITTAHIAQPTLAIGGIGRQPQTPADIERLVRTILDNPTHPQRAALLDAIYGPATAPGSRPRPGGDPSTHTNQTIALLMSTDYFGNNSAGTAPTRTFDLTNQQQRGELHQHVVQQLHSISEKVRVSGFVIELQPGETQLQALDRLSRSNPAALARLRLTPSEIQVIQALNQPLTNSMTQYRTNWLQNNEIRGNQTSGAGIHLISGNRVALTVLQVLAIFEKKLRREQQRELTLTNLRALISNELKLIQTMIDATLKLIEEAQSIIKKLAGGQG